MNVEHEFWIEDRTRAVWAVELTDEVVTGCHGPLLLHEVDDELLDVLEYTTVGVAWITENRERFAVYPTAIPFVPPT
jgi:hypothetical protein